MVTERTTLLIIAVVVKKLHMPRFHKCYKIVLNPAMTVGHFCGWLPFKNELLWGSSHP